MKNSGRLSLLPAERVVRIRDLLAEQGMVTLAEVAAATNASPATVRRDLAYLEKRGLLVRTRGGATVVSQRESRDEEFSRRQSRDRREKRLVAGVAAERLREGDTVFLNDGTSVYALAQRMVRSFKGTVITSGLNIAELLAHSTHVRGSGVMDGDIEKPNVKVTLASKISPEDCARLNLGYMNPAEIDISAWQNREDEGILYVPRAGEVLYRFKG